MDVSIEIDMAEHRMRFTREDKPEVYHGRENAARAVSWLDEAYRDARAALLGLSEGAGS